MDKDSRRIYRPIPPQSNAAPNERDFFWPAANYTFQVGETHEFDEVAFPGQTKPYLPHSNDDIQVNYKRRVVEDGVASMVDMFQLLSPDARATIEEAIGLQGVMQTSFSGRQYVEENTNCHSFGILKCMRQVEVPSLSNTVTTTQHQEDLKIMELARPLRGDMNFDPRRCFLKEVGVVSSS